ncbi:MAG TPA: general stress protein [Chloroflexota bacterium]|jgi:hypothetical protein
MGTVIGAFETRELAARAVDLLLAAGFRPDDVSVLGPHGELKDVTPENERARSIATGAAIGAAVGGLASLLVGAAAFAIPGIGPVLALGPLAGALSAAVGGGLVGGLVGFLMSQGLSHDEAELYAERVRAGAFLVAVRCDPKDEPKAATILAVAGAEAPIRAG